MDLDKVCRLCLSKNENVKYNIYKLIPLVMASASIQVSRLKYFLKSNN